MMVYLHPQKNLAFLGSFAKVFVFCKVYNSINGSRNYRVCRNRNFAKQSFRVGANVSFWTMATKIITNFFQMCETVNLLCFGCLLRDNMLMGGFRSCFVTYKIYLLMLALSRLAIGLLLLRFTSEKRH